MVSERAQGSDDGGFLTAARSSGGYENPGILAPIRSALPFLARGVPEGLPLRREISVTGRNAQEKAIIALKDVGSDQGNIRRLARGVHLGQHFLRKGLLHPTEVLVRSHQRQQEDDHVSCEEICVKRIHDKLLALRTDINLLIPPRPRFLLSPPPLACEYGHTRSTRTMTPSAPSFNGMHTTYAARLCGRIRVTNKDDCNLRGHGFEV